jgi:hypothetical protein
MMKSLVLGALLGGLVAFAWSFVSWMVLPWHNPGMISFSNETVVAQVLMDNATTSGMYILPGVPAGYSKMQGAEKKAAEEAMEQRAKTMPFFYGVVLRSANFDMGKQMAVSVVFDVLAALLVTMLVMRTGGMTYAGRVMFIVTVALAAAVMCVLPNWVWWHYPTTVVVVGMADVVIGWFLAGLVIAKVAAPRAA